MQQKRGISYVLLLVALVVLGLSVWLFFSALQMREAACRSQCRGHFKQLILALHNYHDVHGGFPPAYTVDANGKRLHSWRTLILPFIEERTLYESIDLSKPWDDPVNAAARETFIRTYHCPSWNSSPTQTTYLAVVTPTSAFRSVEPRPLFEITDDRYSTLMVIEVDRAHAVHWMSPQDADEALILGLTTNSKLPHRGGMHSVMVDGTVRFLPASLTAEERRTLISCAGGDKAPDGW